MAFRTGVSSAPGVPPPRTEVTERGLVLVVDDMEPVRALVTNVLRRDGYEVEAFESGKDCIDALARLMPDAIYLDLDMPGLNGLETLEGIRARNTRAPVLILTGDESIDSVVAAMKLGAYDYIVKPPSRQKLLTAVHNAIQHYRMSLQLCSLSRETGATSGYPEIISGATEMKELFRQMDRICSTDISLLVHGESGTGKELVARAVHRNSTRKDGRFVALNCAAVPESLQESELFGHEKGAFTGATARRLGKFELAHEGTLFLDEVGELSLSLQAKLLRVLQDQRFQRVGGEHEIRSDFRLIGATHRDLVREVAAGRFREDLYFRIVVFELELPPLRDRLGDVELLTGHFLERYARDGDGPMRISREAERALRQYPWPGNVRELSNVIRHAVVCAENGVIETNHFPARILKASLADFLPVESGRRREEIDGTSHENQVCDDVEMLNLEHLERGAIELALRRARGNMADVSHMLGISRATLYRKLKKYALR